MTGESRCSTPGRPARRARELMAAATRSGMLTCEVGDTASRGHLLRGFLIVHLADAVAATIDGEPHVLHAGTHRIGAGSQPLYRIVLHPSGTR
ncbi:hypothetical protein LZG04_11885 [Saccharothrix sp. S26]|uniref:hypothetical protein n=1 Tax=Saccharothrix sp. S26 TaxID=2907215 RepID=UPI001F207D2E|nr:hypothetical protein [Saccharothrix sp. S26]MCE6995497.1 hypothetical protein [Saccharothrix sp. S26]